MILVMIFISIDININQYTNTTEIPIIHLLKCKTYQIRVIHIDKTIFEPPTHPPFLFTYFQQVTSNVTTNQDWFLVIRIMVQQSSNNEVKKSIVFAKVYYDVFKIAIWPK